MNLTPYVERLRRELAVAAEAGGEDARALAERLAGTIDAAARLALLEALSAAADEITRDLAPGSVDVRLRGREPSFVVTPPPASEPAEDAGDGAFGVAPGHPSAAGAPAAGQRITTPQDADEGEGGTARISLRVPEQLKPRIDEAAGHAGLSVNAWLVRAITAALEPGDRSRRTDWHGDQHIGRRYIGWVR